MAWEPKVAEGEQILVECSHVNPNGTRFDILVTDRQVAYSKRLAFAVADPIETVSIPRDTVSEPRIAKKKPYAAITGGVLLLALLAYQAYAFVAGELDTYSGGSLMIGVLGIALLVSARNRYRLEWKAGGKRHRLDQPSSMDRATREKMSTALLATFTLLEKRR